MREVVHIPVVARCVDVATQLATALRRRSCVLRACSRATRNKGYLPPAPFNIREIVDLFTPSRLAMSVCLMPSALN